jgi:arylsulfatase A
LKEEEMATPEQDGWSRRNFLRAAGLGAGALAAGAWPELASADGERPNILLILADDLGREALGCYGGLDYQTPNLDQMAADGVRFEHCYGTPLCSPSRVELMTGKYNFRNYVKFGLLDPNEKTFGHLLREAGYKTCIGGKWQLGGELTDNFAQKYGFDEYCLWQFSKRGNRYGNPLLEQNGKALDGTQGKYGPDVVNDFISDFMSRNKTAPFFAYYPMMLTHDPFLPTPDSADWDAGKATEDSANDNRYFKDMVQYMDKLLGKLFKKMDEIGVRKNTLVLFTTDNGTMGIRSKTKTGIVNGGKGRLSEAGAHLPLIAHWPGVTPKGKVLSDLVDFSDVLPTLTEASKSKLPGSFKVDGRSFLPQLQGKAGTPRDWAFCYYDPQQSGAQQRGAFACTQRFKLFHDGRMYDLQKDPKENQTLPEKLTDPEAVAARELLSKAFEKMKAEGANFEFADSEGGKKKKRGNDK